MLRYFLLSLLFLTSSMFARDTYHAILICDKDSELSHLYKNDIAQVENFVIKFCRAANMKPDIKKISAKSVSVTKIKGMFPKKQLKKQNVLIYYAGKDRFCGVEDDYPAIKSKGNTEFFTPGVLSKYCAEKNPNSFVTIIFDCYDRISEYKNDGNFRMREMTNKTTATIKKLLCGHKGAILISSCETGDIAYGFNEKILKGGVFTNIFLSSLLDIKKNTRWDAFLHRIDKACYTFPYIKDEDLGIQTIHQKIQFNLTHMIKKNAEVKTK